jgi:small-conductance mechanosensitive channel
VGLSYAANMAGVSRLGDAGVILAVDAWVRGEHMTNARYDLNKRIKAAFERKGIGGPLAARHIYAAVPRGDAPASSGASSRP